MRIGEVTPEKAREFARSWNIYRRDARNPLWMSTEELEGLQAHNLRRQLELTARFSPYYRELFRREKVEVEKVRSLEDLERIPVTPMEAYLRNPLAFLLVVDPPGELDVTYEITYTSGTSTGTPAPFFNTAYDMYNISLAMRRMAEICWMTPRDTVLNLFPYGNLPHIGFYRTVHLASSVGMKLVNALTGRDVPGFPLHRSLDEALELAAEHRVTVLAGMGRQERRFILRGEQAGTDLSSVRIVLSLGETVTEGMREEMRAHLPGEASRAFIINGYGFTECQGSFVECCESGGNHNPAPNLYHLEVLDPKTLRPLPDGELGLLAITHLDRRGTVLLRYLVGDLVALERGVCPHCGRVGGRLVIRMGSTYAVRADKVVRVEGKLVNPEAVRNQLAGVRGVVEYQLVVEKENPGDPLSPDRLTLRLSVAGRLRQDLEREVTAKVREAVGITPRIEYVQSPEIYDPSRVLKATRIVDRR
ncbi:phenylacetate--CoA ligase family protein [Candidatus Solincola sp.]|nr:AMP-binding protein [Actinomycetota bacterium]MDI7251764.1 AMP-binding protein [Actinomycetota bacterium]